MSEVKEFQYEETCYLTHKNTRLSDSSLYDEVCNVCGLTDNHNQPKHMGNTPCFGYKQVWVFEPKDQVEEKKK